MKRSLKLALLIGFLIGKCALAQPATGNVTNGTVNASGGEAAGSGNSRVVRDPVTGRTYYQQWITETVPTTRWENKQITTTVYETQWVNQLVPSTQTVMQPQTQQILQPVWKGLWNPFRQPTLAYQSTPVTTWVPANVTTNQVVPRQQVIPRQQTITVPQPVTETKTQQRLVQTEIHTSPTVSPADRQGAPMMTAAQTPALINIPLLARRPFASAPQFSSYSPGTGYTAPATSASIASNYPVNAWTAASAPTGQPISAPNSGFQQNSYAQNGLRPITQLGQNIFPRTYSAPMRTAASQGGAWNPMQSGMTPTVLR